MEAVNVSEVLAGPELDIVMAEVVMRWKLLRTTESGAGWFENGDGDEIFVGRKRPMSLLRPWTPSTSIETAWEIVEKMRADGWYFQLDDDAGGYGPWRAEFSKASEDPTLACATTAPLAICRAALLFHKAASLSRGPFGQPRHG